MGKKRLIQWKKNGVDVTCTRCGGSGFEELTRIEFIEDQRQEDLIKTPCRHCGGDGYILPNDPYTYHSRGPLEEFSGFGVRKYDQNQG